MPERREIGHLEAQGAVAAVPVAVVDAHGEQVTVLRTDGCGLASLATTD
jgi:uncharacterized protein GlcG (DUF336 family)